MCEREIYVHIFARSAPREGNETIFGLNFVDDTAQLTSGNGVMGWDFGAPVAPFVNQPAYKPTDTHEKTRRTLTAQAQMHTFFTTGTIVNTCKVRACLWCLPFLLFPVSSCCCCP